MSGKVASFAGVVLALVEGDVVKLPGEWHYAPLQAQCA